MSEHLNRYIKPMIVAGVFTFSAAQLSCNAAFTDVQFDGTQDTSSSAPDPIGTYHGYVSSLWDGAGTTCTELSPTPYKQGDDFCISGEIPFTNDFSGYAQLEFSLNQENESAPANLIEIQGQGLTVNIDNPNGVQLQLQVEAQGSWWCATLNRHNGTISLPFNAFVKECWFGGSRSETFKGSRIDKFKITVPPPPAGVSKVVYDVCARDLQVYEAKPCETQIEADGFVSCGDVHGHAWVMKNATSTATPVDFAGHTAGDSLCIEGELGKNYDNLAAIGINLSQNRGEPAPMPFQVTQNGIHIDYNSVLSDYKAFRIQVTAPGDDENVESWCVNGVPEGGVSIPFAAFQKECWGTEGEPYKNQELANAALMIVADNVNTHPFNFCVNSFGLY